IEHRRIKAQLERRRIKSPIDGIVTVVSKDIGEFVSPTDPIVATVVQLNPLLVVFSVPKNDARTLKKGQRVPVTFDSKKVEGFVEFVSPTTDAQSGTTKVKVRVPNPKLTYQSGDACQLVMFDQPDANLASERKTDSKPVALNK
ncbi:MAG: HlyD family efflux transporter periplasmic adaptor subunit, partial [Planctomycetales bacterium]|nr:HlyD family efflux transporter periplasmic adaptor subunit [Planctomycetales bacterium]